MANRTRAARWLAVTAGAALIVGLTAGVPAANASAVTDDPLTPSLQQLADGGSSSITSGPISTRKSGRVLVDVRVTDTSPDALRQLREVGAKVVFVAEDIRTVTVAIDPSDLEALGSLSALVESAQEVLQPQTNAACPTGSFVSEGLTQLRADLARSQFAVQGRDVTVGILSDSYDVLGGAGADVGNGELPGANNPCGNTTPVGVQVEGPVNRSDEGRAMAQIVHDIAPDAKIIFASGSLGEAAFAQSIRDLAAAGADVIVDDITYFAEPMYQDGVIAKAVADVSAEGVTYFSSAANSNAILGGKNVASYEAQTFRPVDCPAEINGLYPSTPKCHDFAPDGGVDTSYGFSINGSAFYVLGWSEPQFGVTTDLDLCLLDGADALVGCVKSDAITGQRAFESLLYGSDIGAFSLVVVRSQGAGTPRFKLISNRSNLTNVEYTTGSGGDVVGPTTFGHNASRPGVTVGAVPFNNSSVLENFSSFGPATYCWGPVVGTDPAPGTTCETATVDMAATDGTQNSFYGPGDPPRFFGTSAAAPHAAAVAALILDREQCLTATQVIATMKSAGRAVGAVSVDGAGAGLIDAREALQAAGAFNCDTAAPVVTLQAPATANGWYNTASVEATVTATDRRTVTSLTCTGGTVSQLTGIGTTTATGKATVNGDGVWPVTCTGTDFENNTGAGGGSANTATIKIDTTAPTLTCRPASFTVGRVDKVTAGVADDGSGPASATASTAISTSRPGSFTAAVSGTDVAGNTASTSCPYSVAAGSAVSGPSKVKVGAKKSFSATGFPPSTKITWSLLKKDNVVKKLSSRTKASGASKAKFTFSKKGKFVVRAVSGSAKASVKVLVR